MDTAFHSPDDQRPRRSKWRWVWRVGIGLLLALAVRAGKQVYYHQQVTRKLDEATGELDRTDPGWRLRDIQAARTDVPDARNSARTVVAAAKNLPRNWPPAELADRFANLEPPELLPPDAAARLGKELDALRPALKRARKLTDLPYGRYRITYLRNVLATVVDDQQKARQVVTLLRYDALRQAQAGKTKAALNSCRAMLNAARSVGDEPLIISQIIRSVCVLVTCEAVERTLAQGQPGAGDLLAVQRALEEEDKFPALLIMTRGERAVMHEMFDAVESGDVSPSQASTLGANLPAPPNWEERFLGWWTREKLRAGHPTYLSLMTRRVEEVKRPLYEQAEAEKEFIAEVKQLPEEAAFAKLLVPAVDKLGAGARRKHAHLRCTIAALAAERYRREHNAWPESLRKLTPDYLSAVPLDPYDGEPLRYRRLADGAILYSLGPDNRDDGGILDRKNSWRPGTDLGVRLWDVRARRQPPRPAPQPPGR